MQTFPAIVQAFVDRAGTILQPWIGYLQQFTIPPPAFMDIAVTGSPFIYEVKEPGNVALNGGTITNVSLSRGTDTLSFGAGTDKFIPVSIDDIVTVTYAVLPTITFIPSYGQRTTS